MRRWNSRHLFGLLSACLLYPLLAVAQDQPAPQDTIAKPLTPKELKKRDRMLTKELSDPDRGWLLEEVPDIITDAERRAFLELGTEEEREQFIEHIFPLAPCRSAA
jgi:hypothetical protein